MKIDYGYSVISLPGAVIDKLGNASESDLKVIIAICSGRSEEHEISETTGLTIDEIKNSISFWRGAGVISGDTATKRKRITPTDGASRTYTGEEIEKIVETDNEIASLKVRCGEILGIQTFTFSEVSSIIYMRRELALGADYILLLCAHFANYNKVSMRFIEKTALNLHDKGITTIDSLEAYLEKDNKSHDMEYLVKKLFGFGERELTNKEKQFISTWSNDWNISDDLIKKAFDEMIANTQKPNMAYMNAILNNWIMSSIETPEQVEESKAKYKTSTSKAKGGAKTPGFDLDEFFNDAVARGKNSEN
ncbi:MAG: DnaD domain protein [Clostridia bacterium]|nr:DnaD domain protein [Clostridia bacterium]